MNWTECAIDDLKKYGGLKASLKNIAEQIEMLELEFTSLKGNQTDRVPVSGSGGNHYEDFLINNIDKRERLKLLLVLNKKLVSTIHRGLSVLTDEERIALEHFYIFPQPKHIEKLMEALDVERSEVYRLKDRAMRKFVLNMYGLPEYFN